MEENMGLRSTDALLKSSEHESSVQPGFQIVPFTDTQILSENHSTPQKSPAAPPSSPALLPECSSVSLHDDQFAFELQRACVSRLFDDTESSEDTARDLTASPSVSLPNVGQLITKFSKELALDDYAKSANSAEDMVTVQPSTSNPKKLRLPKLNLTEFATEKHSPKLLFSDFMTSTKSMASMSCVSLNTCVSDTDSMIAHRASDVSDISRSESENLHCLEDVSNSYTSSDDLSSLILDEKFYATEVLDKEDLQFQTDYWQVFSPRKQKSSVGKFLNWRKKFSRRINSSSGNISIPETKTGKGYDSKFLQNDIQNKSV